MAAPPKKDRYGAVRLGHQKGVRKVALPVGTIVLRSELVNHRRRSVRYIKVRMDGRRQDRWVLYARWWWQKNRGPVPAGKRVIHVDGNLLNDAPANLAVGGPGDVMRLAHERDPLMSAENRRQASVATAEYNRFAGKLNRLRHALPLYWYPVVDSWGVILNVPFRRRKTLLGWFGVDVSAYPANGQALKLIRSLESQVRAVRGRELGQGILGAYLRVDPEWSVNSGGKKLSVDEEKHLKSLQTTEIWRRAIEGAKTDLGERK